MSDAAQGELSKHVVFSTPFKVVPKYEDWPTPSNYKSYPGVTYVPEKIRVWRVQDTGKTYGSVVSPGAGFGDSPDAEILTEGFNEGKGPHEAGVSRHGNFLQWGFNGSPKQMTDAGQKFFINCVVYIKKFDGKMPLIKGQTNHRSRASLLASYIPRITDKAFASQYFGKEVLAKFKGEPKDYAEALAKYCEDNVEFLYWDGGFHVDEDLKGFGMVSNRKIETLEKLIALQSDPLKKPVVDKILTRYLDPKQATPATVKKWLEENRDQVFFTDTGGYKFMAAPKGYLDLPTAAP
jgi:hypothetical protein